MTRPSRSKPVVTARMLRSAGERDRRGDAGARRPPLPRRDRHDRALGERAAHRRDRQRAAPGRPRPPRLALPRRDRRPSASSLRELFALFRAESDEAIRGGGYEWTMPAPLREGVAYRASGEVTGVERKTSRSLGADGRDGFRIELHDGGGRARRLDRLDLARAAGRAVTRRARHAASRMDARRRRSRADEGLRGDRPRPEPDPLGPRRGREARPRRPADQPGAAEPRLRREHAASPGRGRARSARPDRSLHRAGPRRRRGHRRRRRHGRAERRRRRGSPTARSGSTVPTARARSREPRR